MKNEKLFIIHYHPFDSLELDINYISKNIDCDIHFIIRDSQFRKISDRVKALNNIFFILIDDPLCEKDIKKALNERFDLDELVFDFKAIGELAVSVCGKLRVHFKLSEEDDECFVDKVVMKKRVAKAGLRVPIFEKLDRERVKGNLIEYSEKLRNKIPFPCFIKPLNLAGAILTYKINDIDDLVEWLKDWDNDGIEYEVEEFIEGTLYHCETFFNNGHMVFSQVCEYSAPCFDIKLGTPIGSLTLPNDSEDSIRIKAFSEKVHKALKTVKNGVTHLEVFKKNNGEIVFLEIANRPPGILCSEVYGLRNGLSLKELHILAGNSKSAKYDPKPKNYVFRYIFPYQEKGGTIDKIHEVEINSKFESRWKHEEKSRVAENNGLSDYFGTLVAWNECYETLKKDFFSLNDFKPFSLV